MKRLMDVDWINLAWQAAVDSNSLLDST